MAAIGEENDLRINSSATDAQLEWNAQGDLSRMKKPSREDLEVFETVYNAACAAIARGELGQSEVLLKRAKGISTGFEFASWAEGFLQIYVVRLMSSQINKNWRSCSQSTYSSYTS